MKPNWSELSRRSGIPANTLRDRVNKWGMTLEEALAKKQPGPRWCPREKAISDEQVEELLAKHRKGME